MPEEYDEATCITARELRAMGVTVPENIPDVGWIPRTAVVLEEINLAESNVSQGILNYPIEFTAPFRWLTIGVIRDETGTIVMD